VKIPHHILGMLAAAATATVNTGCGDEARDPEPVTTNQNVEGRSESSRPADSEAAAHDPGAAEEPRSPADEEAADHVRPDSSPEVAPLLPDEPTFDEEEAAAGGGKGLPRGGPREPYGDDPCPACGMG